jgi:hypothetical protein
MKATSLMQVEGLKRTWEVDSEEALKAALVSRDSRGGAEFWLSQAGQKYPCLAVRIGGTLCDVHFFPEDGHPGFRCLGGEGLSPDGMTKLVFEGCDPGDGEQIPNRFVVPFTKALSVARVFFRAGIMSDAEEWFEL